VLAKNLTGENLLQQKEEVSIEIRATHLAAVKFAEITLQYIASILKGLVVAISSVITTYNYRTHYTQCYK